MIVCTVILQIDNGSSAHKNDYCVQGGGALSSDMSALLSDIIALNEGAAAAVHPGSAARCVFYTDSDVLILALNEWHVCQTS